MPTPDGSLVYMQIWLFVWVSFAFAWFLWKPFESLRVYHLVTAKWLVHLSTNGLLFTPIDDVSH